MNMKISSKRSVLALANSIEVATGVVHELVGNSLGKSLHGQKVTRAALADVVGSRLNAKYARHTSKGTK